ncbi:MAG: alpha/beta hydrolase-fold protein, partial [Opitutaceae bacterium]
KNPSLTLAGMLFASVTGFIHAQVPAGPPAAAPAANTAVLASPEVLPDRRVTFRLSAPKATEVTLKGDWHADPKALTRGNDGVWSITLGPFAPSKYIYNFTVDGVTIADPANSQVKLRQRSQGSFFDVAGETAGLGDARDVPHGAIELNSQKSVVLSETRGFLVYTPPGYAQERERRYPVLYLMHGSNDRPQGWVDVGNINYLADNLIAEKKAEPMIIVMPVAHALPFGSRGNGTRNNAVVFEEYLLKDVIPTVEGKYRTAPGRQNRAVAGMSMGGDIAMRVFSNHMDKFAAAGLFSPAGGVRAVPTEKAAIYGDAKTFNATVDAFYVACGKQDSLFASSQALDETLTKLGINHTWRPTEGFHNYALWRQHVIEFLPLLFHPSGTATTSARGK